MEFKPNQFYLTNTDGEVTAQVDFEINDNVLAITHTGVADELRGRGIAGKLMLQVINYAKKNHLKIKPICSYAQRFFAKETKYQDMLLK